MLSLTYSERLWLRDACMLSESLADSDNLVDSESLADSDATADSLFALEAEVLSTVLCEALKEAC